MKYFSRFPTIVTRTSNKAVIIEDFLRRVAITEKFRQNVVTLEDYFILDGETPELVSNRLYGTPSYHWTIFLVNDITNPREEWPVPDNKVVDVVYQKYDFIINVPDGAEYTINDIVTSDTEGEFIVTGVTDNVVRLRSQKGKTILTTSSELTNITTDVTDLTLTSVTDPEEDIHHYYDTDIELIVDEGYSPTTIPVTNYEYEAEENDIKRTIKVLSPSFIPFFVKNFDDEISGV